MSPGINRVQNCFRTPDNRPCASFNYDITDLGTTSSADAHFQMDHFTGPRGKGHCELAGAITDSEGRVVALTPGLKVAATPRGGDSITLGKELGESDKMPIRLGFSRMFVGTPNVGVLLVTDRGFVYIAHNVNRGNDPTPIEWCRNNNVQCIWAFKVGEKCFHYNKATDTLEEVPENDDKTKANNRYR